MPPLFPSRSGSLNLNKLPEDQFLWELQESKRVLEKIFHKPVTGFCYPFNAYNDLVKDAVRKSGYKWARGNSNGKYAFPPEDPMEFHPCCRFSDDDFWNKYEYQRKTNGVFFFWGHSYELINEIMWKNFEDIIKSISSDPNAEWSFVSDLFS